MVDIQLRKFQNQFYNGENLLTNPTVFTHFLLGFVGQKMSRLTQVATSWSSESSISNIFVTVNGGNTITRDNGSWIDDGFQIGDTFDHQPFGDTGTITNVTDLIITIAGTFATTANANASTFHGTSRLLGITYQSNFIENDDPVGYISKVDSISTRQWIGEFTVVEFDAGTLITATASGLVDSWKMDSDLVRMRITQQPILANLYITILEVIEVYTITPFFDNISNLEAGIKPDYLAGALSLRGIASFELRLTSLNPIVKHILDDSDNPETDGNVGYYDEHANGFTPIEFSKDSIAYANTSGLDQIVVDETTTITCKIDSANNVLSQGDSQFQMNIIFLNENIDNTDTIDINFAFDTVFAVTNAAPKSGENGIFSNVEGNIVANQLVVTADIDFSPAQQSLIEDGKYIIAIATNNHTTAIDQSKLVNVNMDINTFIKNNDVPDLMAVDTHNFYEHPHDKGTDGKTDFQGWVEDGILMSTDFTLDLSKDAVINNMNVRLMARNSVTNEDFEIACIPLDFASAIISGGVQQIDIDSTRGFKLIEDSQFNFLKVQTMLKVGDIQHYDLDIGFKLQWMDWQALVDADPVFFDGTKINDGLNRLISNYSALNDYDIVMFIDAEVSNGLLNTNYRFISPALRVYEYDTDDTGNPSTKWSALTETFDQVPNNLNANIHGTENTEVKVTFTALSGLISETPIYGTMRLEEFQQGGLFNIFELSSFRGAAVDNPLIPKAGDNKARFTVFADRIEVECAIDFSKLNPTSQYKISCRLGTACDDNTGCAWETKNSTVAVQLLGVDFLSSVIGIAVGVGGTIVKTIDSADTWATKVSGLASVLRDVFIFDAVTAYACGNSGKVIKSTDGGETWADKSPATIVVLTDLHFATALTGWACGQSGAIFKTTDGGTNWVVQPTPITAFLNSIFFATALTGWAVGLGGKIIKTTDGGTTWVEQTSGVTVDLEEVYFISTTVGWVSGHVDTVLLTTNGGTTWTEITIPGGNNFILRSISFLDADEGITCGDQGVILRSTDGGNTWTQESSGTVEALLDAEMLGLTDAYAVGSAGEIVKYVCTVGGSCDILDGGKLKEDGTQKQTEDGNNKIIE